MGAHHNGGMSCTHNYIGQRTKIHSLPGTPGVIRLRERSPRRRELRGLSSYRCPSTTFEGTSTVTGKFQGSLCPESQASNSSRFRGNRYKAPGHSPFVGVGRLTFGQWVSSYGAVSPMVPHWTSRRGWLATVDLWAASAEGREQLAGAHVSPRMVKRVAVVLARMADGSTGRNVAASNARIAAQAQVSERSVTTVRAVLAEAGWAVEARRGYGSADGRLNRPSIWHLVSRRRPICDLPRTTPFPTPSLVGTNSPSAARRRRSNTPRPQQPRNIHVQRLAAYLAASCAGFWGVRPGRICDVLQRSHLTLEAWDGKQLQSAMNTTMRERGWHWPDHIDNPLGFLAFRIAQLPARPTSRYGGQRGSGAPEVSSRAAQSEAQASRHSQQRLITDWYTKVTTVTDAHQRQRLLQADEVKFGRRSPDPVAALASAGRRAMRLFPAEPLAAALNRWSDQILGASQPDVDSSGATPSSSTDLLMDLAINAGGDCLVCGAHEATMRPQLPLKPMVCERCWPVIAAELADSHTDDHEGVVAA